MKTLLRISASVLAISFSLAAAAQGAAPAAAASGAAPDAAQLQKLRERIRADHKGLVAENMKLTEAEARTFWPAYEKCQKDLDAARGRTNRAIVDYVNGESTMTDAHAKQIAGDLLAAEAGEAKARKSCFDRVAKAVPGKKAVRFLQIETKIRALTRFDAAVAIPLVQ